MEKNEGGKLEGAEMRKILCARLRKGGGGGDKGWETQVYNAYHFKRSEKYSDPLSSPKLFLWFCSS